MKRLISGRKLNQMGVEFPKGYYQFHELENVNFQLNRLVLNGADKDVVHSLAKKIHDFVDWKREMLKMALSAANNQNHVQASSFYRAAEFFTDPTDSDKEIFYDQYIEHFYKANPDVEKLKTKIPYQDSFLPALVFA